MNGKAKVGVLVGVTVAVCIITATATFSTQSQDAAQASVTLPASQPQSSPDQPRMFEAREIVLTAIAASGSDRQGAQAAMTGDRELTLYWSGDQPTWLTDAAAAAATKTNVTVIVAEVSTAL